MSHRHLRVARPPHRLDVAGRIAGRKPRRVRDHRRLHQARQDAVDPDMIARELHGGCLRHLVHRRLGGAVGDVGNPEMADRGDRRDVDDRAAALLLHHGNDVLHGEIGALEIDREDVIPARLVHLDDISHFGDADIVVEHVDAAIGLQARRHHRLDLGFARDVGGESGRLAALAGDDFDGLLGCRRIAIDAKHLRALAREGGSGRLAIAPAGTDRSCAHHHRRLALEPFHRLLLPCEFSFSCSPGEAKRNPGISCGNSPDCASRHACCGQAVR